MFGVIFVDQIKVKADRHALNVLLFEHKKHLDYLYGQERKFCHMQLETMCHPSSTQKAESLSSFKVLINTYNF